MLLPDIFELIASMPDFGMAGLPLAAPIADDTDFTNLPGERRWCGNDLLKMHLPPVEVVGAGHAEIPIGV